MSLFTYPTSGMNLFRLFHKEKLCQRRREHGKFVLTPISKEEHKRLKARKLIEVRYPNLYVSSHVAAVTGEKAKYIKNEGFDDDYYQTMVLELVMGLRCDLPYICCLSINSAPLSVIPAVLKPESSICNEFWMPDRLKTSGMTKIKKDNL